MCAVVLAGCNPSSPSPAVTPPPSDKSAQAMPDQGPGLRVGERAPGFSLVDQSGQSRALGTLGGGLVAIVFYRSADW